MLGVEGKEKKNIADSHLPINLNALYRAQFASPRICSTADIWMVRIRAPSLSWRQSTGPSISMIDGGFEAWIPDIIFTRDCFFSFRPLAASIMACPLKVFYSNRNENNRLKTSIRRRDAALRFSPQIFLWELFLNV